MRKEMAERDKLIVEFSGRRLTREFVEDRFDVALEDELIASPQNSLSTSPNNLDKTQQQGANLSEEPGKSQAAHINLAATPIGEEDEWAEAALKVMVPPLEDFKAAVRSLIDSSDSPEQFETASLALLRSSIIRRKLSRAIAPALSVAFGVGVLDVDEELDADGVAFAEGLSPVMGFAAAIEAVGAKIPVPTARWNELQGSDPVLGLHGRGHHAGRCAHGHSGSGKAQH